MRRASVEGRPVTLVMVSLHLIGCRPLDLLPLTFPIVMSFSRLSGGLLIICPKYCTILCWHMTDKRVPSPSSSVIETLVRMAVHGIRSILRQHHISKASIRLLSDSLRVHVSTPLIPISLIQNPYLKGL